MIPKKEVNSVSKFGLVVVSQPICLVIKKPLINVVVVVKRPGKSQFMPVYVARSSEDGSIMLARRGMEGLRWMARFECGCGILS